MHTPQSSPRLASNFAALKRAVVFTMFRLLKVLVQLLFFFDNFTVVTKWSQAVSWCVPMQAGSLRSIFG